ncbi:MAG: SCO family protein [Candidatus Dormibacteria bacterium]
MAGIAGLVVVGLGIGFGAWALFPHPPSRSASTGGSATPRAHPPDPYLHVAAPNFTLTDQWGKQISLSQFRGRVVLLAFVDPECTTICPLTTEALVQAVRQLGPAASRVRILGIAANPIQHSVADVRAYSKAHGLLMLNSWDFLTGSLGQLQKVWRAYSVYVAAVKNNIDHDPITYVIGPGGWEQNAVWTPMLYGDVGDQAAQVVTEVSAALHLQRRHKASSDPVTDTFPGQASSLPVIAGPGNGGRERFGPGQPHVIVFVASWLSETSDLASQLSALNQYAELAQGRGWPSLVAVDLSTSEPSPGALKHFLKAQQLALRYPVVDDETGGFADGYQVEDAPWIEVTKGSGAIAWRHDGWLTTAALGAEAQQLATA